jgi:hypothetical protein
VSCDYALGSESKRHSNLPTKDATIQYGSVQLQFSFWGQKLQVKEAPSSLPGNTTVAIVRLNIILKVMAIGKNETVKCKNILIKAKLDWRTGMLEVKMELCY